MINFCLPGVGVKTDPEKANNLNTNVADANAPNISRIFAKKPDRAEADRADAKRVEEPSTSTTNPAKADGVEADRAKANGVKVDRVEANEAEIDGAKPDKADKPNTRPEDSANPVEVDKVDK